MSKIYISYDKAIKNESFIDINMDMSISGTDYDWSLFLNNPIITLFHETGLIPLKIEIDTINIGKRNTVRLTDNWVRLKDNCDKDIFSQYINNTHFFFSLCSHGTKVLSLGLCANRDGLYDIYAGDDYYPLGGVNDMVIYKRPIGYVIDGFDNLQRENDWIQFVFEGDLVANIRTK